MYIIPTISTSFIILSAILMTVGLVQLKRNNIEAHEKFMKFSAISALIFFTIYISRTLFIGNTHFGGPESLEPFYRVFLIFHIILATIGGAVAGYQLYLGVKGKLQKHRKLGKWAALIWYGAAITGTIVYFTLYVFYPGGETTGLLRAIFGY